MELKMATKRKTTKRSTKQISWPWMLVFTLFMLELFFYTWCRVQCVQVGLALSAERRKQQELSTLENSLKIELARLKAPERVMRIAQQNLGLQMPEPKQTIMVP